MCAVTSPMSTLTVHMSLTPLRPAPPRTSGPFIFMQRAAPYNDPPSCLSTHPGSNTITFFDYSFSPPSVQSFFSCTKLHLYMNPHLAAWLHLVRSIPCSQSVSSPLHNRRAVHPLFHAIYCNFCATPVPASRFLRAWRVAPSSPSQILFCLLLPWSFVTPSKTQVRMRPLLLYGSSLRTTFLNPPRAKELVLKPLFGQRGRPAGRLRSCNSIPVHKECLLIVFL